ncbi:MAG TPA: hypothetical protein VF407_22735 [Polyangiaceae bacterium]
MPANPTLARVGQPVVVTSDRGRIFTTLLAESKVFFYFEGHVDLDFFARTMMPANQAVLSERATLYGDGEVWKTYGAGYREEWTRWISKNQPFVSAIHLLTRSAILKMGVQVVNMFTNNSITTAKDARELYARARRDVPWLQSHLVGWPSDIAARVEAALAEEDLATKKPSRPRLNSDR